MVLNEPFVSANNMIVVRYLTAKIETNAMDENPLQKPVPENVSLSDKDWFDLAVASFIIAAIVIVFAAAWVFLADDHKSMFGIFGSGSSMAQRAQAFAPFGVALGAVVTFCTIAWRGVLNTRQLEYQALQLRHQAEQLEQTRRQNDAKDEENLAKLLIDGAKLLGDEKESHVLAGVAALQAIVSSPKTAFASHAMDILADLVKSMADQDDREQVVEAARNALNQGAKRDYVANRSITIDISRRLVFPAINGVRLVTYTGGFVGKYDLDEIEGTEHIRFRDVTFHDCTITEAFRGSIKCTFVECRIEYFNGSMVDRNTFRLCNFSGAEYVGGDPFRWNPDLAEKLLNGENYYIFNEPIRCEMEVDWSEYLIDKFAPPANNEVADQPA